MFDLNYMTDDELLQESVLLEGMLFQTKNGKAKVSDNIQTIDKTIDTGLTMLEKFIPLVNSIFQFIKSNYKSKTLTVEKAVDLALKFHNDSVAIDHERGTVDELRKRSAAYVKLRSNKIFNMADYRSKPITDELVTLIKKCSNGGEYGKRIIHIASDYSRFADDFKKLSDEILSHYNGMSNVPDQVKCIMSVIYDEYVWFEKQARLYDGDMIHISLTHFNSKIIKKLKESDSIIEAVINYDMSDLKYALQECDTRLDMFITNHNTISGLLTESSSDKKALNKVSIDTFIAKAMDILNSVKNFIMNKIKEIISFFRSLIYKNKEFDNKYLRSIEKRLGSGEYIDGPSMDFYQYTFNTIDLSRYVDAMNSIMKRPEYNFAMTWKNWDTDGDINRLNIEQTLAGYSKYTPDQLERIVVSVITRKNIPENEAINDFIFKACRHGRDIKQSRKFNDLYIKTIRDSDNFVDQIESIFKSVLKNIETEKYEVSSLLQNYGTYANQNEGSDVSMIIAFYRKQLSIFNIGINTITKLNMAKLKAFTECLTESKKFCMMAYAYKKPSDK